MIGFDLNRDYLLTANQRMHWALKANRTRYIRDTSAAWTSRYKGPKPATPCRCIVTFGFPDKRRRDSQNLQPTAKAIVDGLVDAGLIPDDSTTYLVGVDTRIVHTEDVRPGRIAVLVTFDNAN